MPSAGRTGRPAARLALKTLLYLIGTLLIPRMAFRRLSADEDRKALAIGVVLSTGVLYALRALAFAAAGAMPLAPGFPGIAPYNYFAWEILFAVPVFLAAWAAAAVVFRLGPRGAKPETNAGTESETSSLILKPFARDRTDGSRAPDESDLRTVGNDTAVMPDEDATDDDSASNPAAMSAGSAPAAPAAAAENDVGSAAAASAPDERQPFLSAASEELESEAETAEEEILSGGPAPAVVSCGEKRAAAAFALAAAAGTAWIPGALMAIALLLGGSQAAWAEALSRPGVAQLFFLLMHALALGIGLRLAIVIAGPDGEGSRFRRAAIALAAWAAAMTLPALFIR